LDSQSQLAVPNKNENVLQHLIVLKKAH
jgi:hypothetical protein